MSKSKSKFSSIARNDLRNVSGGATRAANSSSDTSSQLQLMMSQIGDSIKELANKPQDSSSQMMPMMMMMMMGGGGGGGGAAAAPPPPPPPPPAGTFVKVNVR
jgi:hypothetical protein